MRHAIRLALLALLVFFTVGNTAEPDPERLALVERLVKLDGTELQLSALRDQMLEGIVPYSRTMAPDDYALLHRSVEVNFDGKTLFQNFRVVMVGQISTSQLQDAITWFETPLARHFSELQVKSTTPEGIKEMRLLAKTVEKTPPPAARDKLLKELDSTLKATDLFVDLAVNISEGISAGVLAAKGSATQEELTAIRKRLSDMRQQALPQIRKSTYINNLYSYSSVSDADLREYTKFFATPVGRAVIQASFYALNDSLQKASEEVGREVASLRKIKAEAAEKARKDKDKN